MDEIKDTPTDRTAIERLIDAYPTARPINAEAARVEDLNAWWAVTARELFDAPDGAFNCLTVRLSGAMESAKQQALDTAAWERATELVDLIVDERWHAWAAREVEAGRNPYEPYAGD